MKQMGGFSSAQQITNDFTSCHDDEGGSALQMGGYTHSRQMGDAHTAESKKGAVVQIGSNDPVQRAPNDDYSGYRQQQKPYTEADRIREEQARQMGCDL